MGEVPSAIPHSPRAVRVVAACAVVEVRGVSVGVRLMKGSGGRPGGVFWSCTCVRSAGAVPLTPDQLDHQGRFL